MIVYGQNSRYYNCDTANDLPQSNLLKNVYIYNTTFVQANEVGRLDLISYRVYNTPVYWWIIARFNGILNPDNVLVGMQLKIPVL